MKKQLSDAFIKSLAELRAKELFTKDFFETCTDSWYYDEFFEFKSKKAGVESRKPTDDEAYKYMGWMQEYKDIYEDEYFGKENALVQYGCIINKIREAINLIDEGKKRYKEFSCTDDIINNLKSIGNYFVNSYNNKLEK